MPVDGSLDRGETDPRTLEVRVVVQPLEDAEEFVVVYHVKTYAVVFDITYMLIPIWEQFWAILATQYSIL